MFSRLLLSLSFVSFSLTGAWAQDTPQPTETQQDPFASFGWQFSGEGKLGSEATIVIPEGYKFLNGREAAKAMEMMGNTPSTYSGMIGPKDLDWFVVFQFEDSGYVDDSEKDDLDADELLEDLQEGDKISNEHRESINLDTLDTIGWAVEPKYNESTHNLEWGVILRSGNGQENVNYLTKVLGRRGIMHTTLVCDQDQLHDLLPEYQNLLADLKYNAGETYAEYEEGDKIAEYGLKGLVAGGAIFAAAKLGLFAKLALFFKKGFKIIAVAVVAVGLWLKRLITGKQADA